jgi:S-formylglutathione hydrolase FrmB
VEAQVHSPGLAHNLLGDSTEQTVAIYLPVAYDVEPHRRFATVYLLHGYADTPALGVAKIMQEYMDKLLAAAKIEPMIVVAPNGLNRLLGSFYTNSEVTGDWEDYIVRDVVGYVDKNFRTIATAESRGLSGHSMGGYGALMLGFKHPDVFAYVYAMSPCCTLLQADLGPASAVWQRREQAKSVGDLPGLLDHELLVAATIAMSAAFTPDKNLPPFYGKSPFIRRGKEVIPDPETLSRFQSNIVAYAIPGLLPKIFKLKGIYIDYGAEDEFSHIPVGAQAVSAELSAAGVPHTLEVYEGSHGSRVRQQVENRLIPWFSMQLRHESAKHAAGIKDSR